MRVGAPPTGSSTARVAPEAGSIPEGRIAVCHIASGDRWAGAEAQLADLLSALVHWPELQLFLILLNDGKLAEDARASGVEVVVFPESRMGFASIFFHASRYLKGRRIHILHSHRYKENLLAALLAWRCRIPFLVRTQHGLPERFRGVSGFKHALLQRIDQWVAGNLTDCTISVSAEQKDHLTRYLDAKKVVTIRNAVSPARVQSVFTRAEAKGRLGIGQDTWLVGTAGRLDRIKRVDIFLEAAKRITAQLANVRFVIAGEGSEERQLRNQAHLLGLDGFVQFLGNCKDICDVVGALDVFVICSDHEGLPMVLLEALLLGVPVVARAVGGIPEVIQNGVTGLLVDSGEPQVLAEACLGLLHDAGMRARLAASGARLIAEEFSTERAATEVAEIYLLLCRKQ